MFSNLKYPKKTHIRKHKSDVRPKYNRILARIMNSKTAPQCDPLFNPAIMFIFQVPTGMDNYSHVPTDLLFAIHDSIDECNAYL